ncbi:MAG: RNA polymerase sigma factor [Lachnospiraceae bacterium]|nr:RNA polymerase sigma factor [Lachnospiraceae bacterium]
MDEQRMKELVKRMKQGDQSAYEEVYRETYRSVYFICLGFMKHEENAKDAMQDTYMTAFSKLEQLKEEEKFHAWLKQIAVNRCKRLLEQTMPELLETEDLENLKKEENENFLPEEYITNKAKRKIVMDIMRKKLSDIQYQTVILFYFNGLELEEIADLMECPPGTVKSRLSVARNKIKEGVLEYEKENKDKLYSFIGIPFLTSLLAAEASGMEIPDIWDGLSASLIQLKKENIDLEPKGENIMSKNVKAGVGLAKSKIMIGVIATVALIGTGVGIAVGISKGNDNGNINETITEVNQDDSTESSEISEDVQAEVSEESVLVEVGLAKNPAFYLNYHYDVLGDSLSDEDLNIVFFDDGINKITSNVTIEDLYAFIAEEQGYSDRIDDWESVKNEYMTLDAYLDLEIEETKYNKDLNLSHNERYDIYLYSTTNINDNGANVAIAKLEIENWFSDEAEHSARECLEAGYWNLEILSEQHSVIVKEGYDTLPDYLFVNAGTPDYITNINGASENHQERFMTYLSTEFTEDTTNYQYAFYEASWMSGNNVIRCNIYETNEQKDRFITCYASPCGKAYMEYMIENRETVSNYSGYEPTYEYQQFLKDCGLK